MCVGGYLSTHSLVFLVTTAARLFTRFNATLISTMTLGFLVDFDDIKLNCKR